MKKTVNKKQFENLIAECIQEVISESRQIKPKKPTRKVMNEAQLQNYIQNIINEELENEGVFNQIKQGVKGAAAGMFGKGRGGVSSIVLRQQKIMQLRTIKHKDKLIQSKKYLIT